MYFQFASHLQLVAFNEKTEFYQEIVLYRERGEKGICKVTAPFKIIATFKIKLSKKLIINVSNIIRNIHKKTNKKFISC